MLSTELTQRELVFVAYYMRLEIAWILANLTYTSNEVCYEMMVEGPQLQGIPRKLSCIVEFISSGLDGDMAMADLITFMLGNLSFDSDTSRLLLDATGFLAKFQRLVSSQTIPPQVLENVSRVCDNLARLDEREDLLKKQERVEIICIVKSIILEAKTKNDSFLCSLSALKAISDNADDYVLGLIGAGSMVEHLI